VKSSAYLETPFLSYVAALPNAEPLVSDRIRWSQEWWRRYREDFRLCISQSVVDECLRGNAEAAGRRTRLLTDLTRLPITDEVSKLAQRLVEKGVVPVKVTDDALHIACAAVHGCDFLLTWNFKHIHNPFQSRPIRETIEAYGYRSPVICAPDSFLG